MSATLSPPERDQIADAIERLANRLSNHAAWDCEEFESALDELRDFAFRLRLDALQEEIKAKP